MNKIICVGFHKTGTTSLSTALKHLGYRVLGPQVTAAGPLLRNEQTDLLERLQNFDACQDNPWPLLFRELDTRYPDSRFILSLRPLDEWIQSVVNHFGNRSTPMRQWIYGQGSPIGHETIYIERHRKHLEAIRAHFLYRKKDLLEISLTAGHGWAQLCSFLNMPVPDIPFPHANRRQTEVNR